MPNVLDWVLALLLVQGCLGAFDTIYHHELTERLPMKTTARTELCIHAIRALLYGIVFAGIAWLEFHGLWGLAIAGLVLIEIILTLWDFVQEDESRKLPASERVLHTVLAINGGALFGLYAWQLARWASLPNALVPANHGWQSLALTVMAGGVAFSGLRDGLAAYRLGHGPTQPNPFGLLAHQRVLITGGTGFIGTGLVSQLLDAGHQVTVLTRQPLKAGFTFRNRVRCVTNVEDLHSDEQFDAVINLAGAPVVGPRWSKRRKSTLMASRLETTDALLGWLARANFKPDVWLQASAIGFYGVRPAQEKLAETSMAGGGFMSELCRQWEVRAQQVLVHKVRLVTLRLGLVLGHGGALPALLVPLRLGLGGHLGSGLQIMSWIHLDDVLAVVAAALGIKHLNGVYNAVAPDPVTQAEFVGVAARLLRRPVWFPVPAFLLRGLLGEMAQLFVDGQRVIPARLQQAGFKFRYPTLQDALTHLLK